MLRLVLLHTACSNLITFGGAVRGACCPNQFPLRMWGRHSCLPVLGTFQSPDSASNRQLWSAKLENFATGRLESLPYKFEQHAPRLRWTGASRVWEMGIGCWALNVEC